MQIHVVQKGDTLWKLSQAYAVSLEELTKANGLSSQDLLVVGQAVIIPAQAHYHKAAAGETLWGIAQRYGITLKELAKVNQIHNPALIYADQTIVIPQPTKPMIEVNAYSEQLGPEGVDLIHKWGQPFTYLSPFSYRVHADGSLKPLDDSAIIKECDTQRTAPMMVITNYDNGKFSSEVAHTLLISITAQNRLIETIFAVMKEKGYRALNVDLEYVPQADRDAYSAFLQKLVDRLHPQGYLVSTALAPKLSADQAESLYEAHDYAAHGRIVDFVILMTYEWGWSGGPPRAVAPLNEVVKVLHYALTVIPPYKIMLGMPLYGYDWTLPYRRGGNWAPTISPYEAVNRAAQYNTSIQYDDESQSPFYNYYDERGQEHIVWYEDVRSVQAKFNIVKTYKLRGVSYWVLGIPFPQNWYVLRANFTIKKLVSL